MAFSGTSITKNYNVFCHKLQKGISELIQNISADLIACSLCMPIHACWWNQDVPWQSLTWDACIGNILDFNICTDK